MIGIMVSLTVASISILGMLVGLWQLEAEPGSRQKKETEANIPTSKMSSPAFARLFLLYALQFNFCSIIHLQPFTFGVSFL